MKAATPPHLLGLGDDMLGERRLARATRGRRSRRSRPRGMPPTPSARSSAIEPVEMQHAQPVGRIHGARIDVEGPAIGLLGAGAIAHGAARVSQIRPVAGLVESISVARWNSPRRVLRPILVDGEQAETVVRHGARRRERDRRLFGRPASARSAAAPAARPAASRAATARSCSSVASVGQRRGLYDTRRRRASWPAILQRACVGDLKHHRVRVPGGSFDRARKASARPRVQRRQRLLERVPLANLRRGIGAASSVAGCRRGDIAERAQPLLGLGRDAARGRIRPAPAEGGDARRHRRDDVGLGGETSRSSRGSF